MRYFDTLPKIIQTDGVGTSRIFTNLLARVSMIPNLLKDPAVYYRYDIQEGDTPEIIAYKYYGESYRYWIVLFANELLDPEWDWPMSSTVFDAYMTAKYPSGNTTSTIHHYEKTLTQTDIESNLVTINTVNIDEDDYNTLQVGTLSYTSSNVNMTITTTKKAVNVYDYELSLNESKRNIRLLNSNYVNELETQFAKLMAS